MCKELRELFKDEIDAEMNQKLSEQAKKFNIEKSQQTVTHIETIAKNLNTSIEAACKALDISIEDYHQAKNLINNENK